MFAINYRKWEFEFTPPGPYETYSADARYRAHLKLDEFLDHFNEIAEAHIRWRARRDRDMLQAFGGKTSSPGEFFWLF